MGEVVGGVDVEGEQRVAPHDELDAEREREVLVPVERARSVGERERQVDRDRSDVRAIASQVGDEGDRAGTDEIDEGACAHEVTVRDEARGIPIDLKEYQGKRLPAATIILTVPHSGGKFDEGAYKTAGGLHGVGATVINALSEELQLTVWRDGVCFTQGFRQGEAQLHKLRQLTPQARETLLPRMMSGHESMCFGMSEPGAGSDAMMMKTRAVPDGAARVVGEKRATVRCEPDDAGRLSCGACSSNADCADDEVYTGACGSGRDNDCGRDSWASKVIGGNIWHAIQCCKTTIPVVTSQ